MSLRLKVLIAQAPLAIALVLIGVLAAGTLRAVRQDTEAILKDNYRSILAAERMQASIERIQSAPWHELISDAAEQANAQATAERRRFESELSVQEGNLTEPGEGDATHTLRSSWVAYTQDLEKFHSIADAAAARTFFLAELEPAFAAVRKAVDTILTINQAAMLHKSQEAQEAAARMNSILLLASFAAVLGGGLLSVTFTRRLLQPLGLLTRTVQEIGEGNFDARVGLSGRDELAQLATHVNVLAARLTQYRRSSLGELLFAQQGSQAAIDSLPDPVVVFDVHGGVLNVNRGAESVLGLTLEAGEGDPLDRMTPPVRATLEAARDHALSGKGAYTPEGFDKATLIASTNGERYFLPRATPVHADEGGITGATVIFQDVTRLRRVDELRNDLVATVAHELRTPLTSLRMAIHLCLETVAGPLTEQQADLLYASRDDCERLQSIVDELLHLARIQGGQIQLDERPTAPPVLVETAIEAHQAAAAERHIQLEAAVFPGLSDVVADRERVQLVLGNLLNNAIRHSPPRAVVTVRAVPGSHEVRFEVADMGEGIPKEFQSLVFEKFFRIPGSSSGGTGLGLSIAKEIVDAHGGRIGVESAPGHGSTFWFTLPTPGALEWNASSSAI